MRTLTVKSFILEFLLHFVIFNTLLFFGIHLFYPWNVVIEVIFGFNTVLSSNIQWKIWLYIINGYSIAYCILYYHLFFKKILMHVKLKKLLLILIFLIAGFCICDILAFLFAEWLLHIPRTTWFNTRFIFHVIYFTVYPVVYSLIRGFSWLRAQKLQIEKENAKASLQNLRAQIEPHFIFNTLNSIYALSIEEKARKTSASIEELSGLFRYALKDSTADKIPVQEELDFLEKYIHLNKIRVQENKDIKLNANIFWDKKPAQIAPMLIITFIENAFKYGISFKRASFIDINISIEDCRLFLVVRNSLHEENTETTNGLGLINTRKRLELLYSMNYFLGERQDEVAHEVIINLNLV